MPDRQEHIEQKAQWFALRVYRNLVNPIMERCLRAGMETYRPMRMTEYFTDGGTEYREEPLVGNLFFVKTEVNQVIALCRESQNRASVYCRPGTLAPAPIADAVMEMFMLAVKVGAHKIETVDFPLDKGDRVRVVDGMFKGAEGYIRRIHGTKRFVVAIEGVVAVAVTHIPRQFLEKIDEPTVERQH